MTAADRRRSMGRPPPGVVMEIEIVARLSKCQSNPYRIPIGQDRLRRRGGVYGVRHIADRAADARGVAGRASLS